MARVLLVDDDDDIRALVTIQLRRAGHEPLAAASAAQALELVLQTQPDVAVLDVTLPGMSGFDLLKELRSRPGLECLRVIFLSGHVEAEHVEAGRALGADYVRKPFDVADLLSAIERACSRPPQAGDTPLRDR